MIYRMTRDLETLLQERKFPVRVAFGPERTTRDASFDSGIVIERDRGASDSFDVAHGQHVNPRRSSSRYLATKATIYARSSLPGAHEGDNEDLCEQYLDALITALRDWSIQAVNAEVQITDDRYSDDPEFEAWPGVVYELKFRVPRGVSKRDFSGFGRPEGSPAGVVTTKQIT